MRRADANWTSRIVSTVMNTLGWGLLISGYIYKILWVMSNTFCLTNSPSKDPPMLQIFFFMQIICKEVTQMLYFINIYFNSIIIDWEIDFSGVQQKMLFLNCSNFLLSTGRFKHHKEFIMSNKTESCTLKILWTIRAIKKTHTAMYLRLNGFIVKLSWPLLFYKMSTSWSLYLLRILNDFTCLSLYYVYFRVSFYQSLHDYLWKVGEIYIRK